MKEINYMNITRLSFIKAIVKYAPKISHEIIRDAFKDYMIGVYKEVFEGTEPKSQKRFDQLREFIKDNLQEGYLELIESTSHKIKIKYLKCEFIECLEDNNLREFGTDFCMSDEGFTEELLPEIKFTRKHCIEKGDEYCDNCWKKI